MKNHSPKKSVLISSRVYQTKKYILFALLVLSLTVVSLVALKSHIHAFTPLVILAVMCILGYWAARYFDKPQLSFSLTFMHLQHHTKKGGWCVKWCNIQEIGIPRISYDGWYQGLPAFGIKLKNYEPLLDNISLRLASHMIIEQRGMLILAFRHSEMSEQTKIEDIILDDTPYVSLSGKTYKGLIAMLANRMVYTRQLLGFDVIIHEDVLDRSAADFVGLTREYLASSSACLSKEP